MRMLKIIFITLFVFLILGLPKKTEAFNSTNTYISRLATETSCVGLSSTIKFTWDVSFSPGWGIADSAIGYDLYFWKTGDAQETLIDDNFYSNKAVTTSYTQTASGLPAITPYDWYVKIQDTRICFWPSPCEIKVTGQMVTSKTCDATLPVCIYTYSDWSACIGGQKTRTATKTNPPCTGDPEPTSQYCSMPTNIYNCANRSPECSDLTKYPASRCFDYSYSSEWKCTNVPHDCPMSNQPGSLSNVANWTNSCAFNIDQSSVSCKPLGATDCNGGMFTDNCCPGSVCDPPGADSSALANGTCVASGDSLGDACYICANGLWSDILKSCIDTSGNKVHYLDFLYCGSQPCIQGTGCKAPIPATSLEPTHEPPPPPCTDASGNIKANCDTAVGGISTEITGFIKTFFAIALVLVGGLATILIIMSGYKLTISRGEPEKIKEAQEQLTAAIVGLLFIIFALVFLEVIGVDFLGLRMSL